MADNRKKRWNLPRLSRRGKVLRNLALVLVSLYALWAHFGYPLPTAEMEFRRLERENLLQPAEEIWMIPGESRGGDLGAYDLTQPWAVGFGGGRVYAACLDRRDIWRGIESFPLEDGPTPVPMSGGNMYWWSPGYVFGFRCPLLFVQIPEEAASAQFELDVTYLDRDYHREDGGFKLDNGMWLFAVDSPDTAYDPTKWYKGGAYTLRLYNGAGEQIFEKESVLPTD